MDQALDHILAGWMSCDPHPRIVVDEQLTAVWVSPAAQALLDDASCVLRRNARILPRDVRLEAELRSFVADAGPEVSARCIADRRSGDKIVLTATRLPDPWGSLVGLTLQRAVDEFDVHMADLQQALGLTRTEARVARHIFCGNTAEETAQKLKISLETVRTHIKRSYAKLNVSSREGFFHKLTPFVISLSSRDRPGIQSAEPAWRATL